MVVFNNLRRLPEKPAHDFPQPQRLDAGIAVVQATDQRRDWVPARPAYRQAPLLQIPVQRRASERCQGHPGWLAAFAGDVKPVITCGVDLDVSQSRIGQLADPQSRRVTEIQHETKSLRCGCLPAVRPLKPVGDGACEQPFSFGEGVRGFHGHGALAAAHLDAGKGVGYNIALLHQPAEHGAEHGKRVRNRTRREVVDKRSPVC